MTTYSDYFELPKGYKPVIDPSSIKDANVRWQDTFPHETFISLLKATERMLGRDSSIAKKPLWIEGAYGTGKSRIAWTLQNLLTCRNDELESYFEEYDDLRNEQDLKTKLLGHKSQGKIVAVMRYGSGEINSTEDLVAAVYDSISSTLEKEGIPYDGGKTLKGGLLKWLGKKANRSYLDSLIKEEPYCYKGCFAGQNSESIKSNLENGNEVQVLIQEMLRLLRDHGFSSLPFKMEDLTSWITETIQSNDLKALVFIWDEFSNYFKNNKTRLDVFQKLAELSDYTPFNLIIVTHYSGAIFSDGDQSAKIVKDRFIHQTIEMPESIAFQLIGHVLKIKNEKSNEWAELSGDLNDRVKNSRKKVTLMLKGVKEEYFKKILPFHPYGALILKNIAQLFDSNQRSMFNFIVDDEPNLHAFQWYIENYGPFDEDESNPLLSVDMLWDYFYSTGHGSAGIGKSNLDQMVSNILDVYPNQESKLTNKEQRVLKIILIFQALAKKLNNAPEFLGTEDNLGLAFEGIDGLDLGKGINLAKNMVEKKILFVDQISGKDVYLAPMAQNITDTRELEKIKSQKMAITQTSDLIKQFTIENLLQIPVYLKSRYIVHFTSLEKFKTSKKLLLDEDSKNYKMKALLLLASKQEEANLFQDKIKETLNNSDESDIIIIDASHSTLSFESFEKWAYAAARHSYYQKKDLQQAGNGARDAEQILQDWGEDICNGSFVVYTNNYPEGISCPSSDAVFKELESFVSQKYPYSYEFTPGLSEAIFKDAIKAPIMAGVYGSRDNLPPKTACVIEKNNEASILKDAANDDRYWEHKPDNPLSRLKIEVDSMCKKAFSPKGPGRIAIGDIVDALIAKGLMPNNLGGFLTGFLLKEYAGNQYRYSDGDTSAPMTQEQMVSLILNYMRKINGETKYKECYIEVLTEEQRLFAELAKNVFHLQDNASIDVIAQQICSKVKEFQYPLWCFKYLPESTGIQSFIDKFSLLLNPANSTGSNSSSIATSIGELIKDNPHAEEKLKEILTADKAYEAMSAYLDEFENGELKQIAKEINAPDLMGDVRYCFSADGVWLWDKETAEQQIKGVLRDYTIVSKSIENSFISPVNTFYDCMKSWKSVSETLKMSAQVLIAARQDLKVFLSHLLEIANDGKLDGPDKRNVFCNEISKNSQLIRDFLNGKKTLFRTIYETLLAGLDEVNIDKLYLSLDNSSFIQEKSIYENALRLKIEDLKQSQTRTKLVDLWKAATKTKSPEEWSQLKKTPILVMIDEKSFKDAKAVFDVLNDTHSSSDKVQDALEILEKHPEFLEGLNDESLIEQKFKKAILKKYELILKDLNTVREKLGMVLGSNVYEWYGHPKLNETIQKLASQEYHNVSPDLVKKIDCMSEKDAKKYLLKLIENEMETGLSILIGE